MGKKGEIGRKRKLQAAELDAEDGSDEPIDPELQAELNAVLSMRAERGEAVVGSTEASAAPGSGGGYKLGKEALAKATESLGTHSLPFIESMQICKFDLSLDDENDDLARELAFYNHSLAAVEFGRKAVEAAGVPFNRPEDFFCEQVKSDQHMAKIKDNLILQEKKMEAFEQRKNRELNKKFNKQVSVQRKDERKQQMKEQFSAVKRLRTGGDTDKEEKLSAILDSKGPQKSKKRINMDRKYGFGGKEGRGRKMNDQKSLNDFSQYHPKGGQVIRRDRESGRGSSGRGGGRGGRGGGRGGGGFQGGRGGGGGGDRSFGGGRGGAGGGRGGRGGSNRPGKEARNKKRAASRG